MTFTETEKISHTAAPSIANQITDPAKKAEALAALRNDPAASISMSRQGLNAPVYQWTSSLDPNVRYTMTVNGSVPEGVKIIRRPVLK